MSGFTTGGVGPGAGGLAERVRVTRPDAEVIARAAADGPDAVGTLATRQPFASGDPIDRGRHTCVGVRSLRGAR
jgi:hypothetical protein